MKQIMRSFTIFCLLIGLLGLVGCSSPSSLSETNAVAVETKEIAKEQIEEQAVCTDWNNFVYEGTMEL